MFILRSLYLKDKLKLCVFPEGLAQPLGGQLWPGRPRLSACPKLTFLSGPALTCRQDMCRLSRCVATSAWAPPAWTVATGSPCAAF